MVYKRPAYRPPAAPRPHSHRLPRLVYWRRRSIVLLALAIVIALVYFAATLFFALLNPSYGSSLSTRASQWGRQHGLASVVRWGANEAYHWDAPKKGGEPPAGSFGKGALTRTFKTAVALPPPADIVSPDKIPLVGEGVWHAAGRTTANGIPTMYEAFVRPDGVHTSYVVGVVWMDTNLLTAQLYSGSQIPGGGPFWHQAPISSKRSTTLVAAFNSGFLMQNADGGYFTDGKSFKKLRKGAASVVIFKNGRMTVAKWGRDVVMTNQIASVRQNLDLIVDNSKEVHGLRNPASTKWGSVINPNDDVWRSGLGITKSGALVYVGGPSMSLSDLANVMLRAGVEEGMELDYGLDWVQLSTYAAKPGTVIDGSAGTSLLPSMPGTPDRYFGSYWAHDFFTMSLRSNELKRTIATTTTSG
jgi:phosphodiester glycosidase